MSCLPRLLLFLAAGSCFSQQFGIGVKAGIRATGDIDSFSAQSESKRYAIGPMFDLGLPLRFGIEADVLYSRTGFRTGNGGFWGGFESRYRANTWEFPILLKHRLPLPLIKPYVEGGYVLRRISGSYTATGYAVDIPTGNRSSYTSQGSWKPDVSHGLAAGGGIELGGRHLRFAPEIRYTRWNNDPINFSGSQGYHVNAAQNQLDILLGITWRK